MFYVIQENVFREEHYDMLIDLIKRHKFEYDIVKYRPFLNEIVALPVENDGEQQEDVIYKTDRKNVFCFGAVSMAKAATKYGWNPGSMMNKNHDYEVYGKAFGFENMLNGEGHVINFIDKIPIDNFLFFARPTRDTKVFSGQIFTQDSWKEYVAAVRHISDETKILISPLKQIQQEVRCWVIGGKIVTASSYKIGTRVVYTNYDDETFFTDFAQKMIDVYQPAEAFVIDIALANDKLSVIEINNINSAGFYDCNMVKLITALENHFN